MTRRILLFISFFYAQASIIGQCDISIDVPDDITICVEDDLQLLAVINGTESCFNWVSDQGHFSDTEIDPVFFVDQNTNFTFTASGSVSSVNLIVNGDFENGDDGSFISDYTQALPNCIHAKGFLGCEGFYEIMDDPSIGHSDFSACGPMGGQQMIVNGALNLQQIWCQTVDVEIDKKYEFSAWGQSVHPTSPGLLQFSIDGSQIGSSLSLSSATCSWEQIREFWISPITGPVEICVTNQSTALEGNDFAIDDIFFGEICSEEKNVFVEVSDSSISPETPDFFLCSTSEVQLNINPSGFNTPFDYNWFNEDGNFIDGIGNGIAFISEPGIYEVTVTDQLGCTLEHQFDVVTDQLLPSIDLLPINPIIQCGESFVEISNNLDDVDYVYQWNFEGISFSDDNVLEAMNEGSYELIVTDVTSGCSSTVSFEVEVNAELPNIEASFSNPIDCNNTTADLILNTNENLVNINWVDEFGISVTNTTVSSGGFYQVFVEADNGCTTNDFINIPEEVFDPAIELIQPSLIDCNNPTSVLSVNNPNNLNLAWIGPNNYAESGNDLSVGEAGNYQLVASNAIGCSQDYTIEIFENLESPTIELSPIPLLGCDVEEVLVSVTNFDPNLLYQLTLPNQTIVDAGVTMLFFDPGNYILTATASNGCSDSQNINIEASGDLPTIDVMAENVNCDNAQTTLRAIGIYDNIQWSNENGPITDLDVSTEGWYYALVDNGGTCQAMDSIYISVDISPPLEDIQVPIIGCDGTEYILYNLLDDNYGYEWILPDGSHSQTPELTISSVGTYFVTITSSNGCTAENSFEVNSDAELPNYTIDGIEALTCDMMTLELMIESQSVLESVTLTAPNGNTQDNSLIIEEAGMHSIFVVGSNGCTSNFEFIIEVDTLVPGPIISNTNINCTQEVATLSVINPSANETYTWTNIDGSFEGPIFETNTPGLVSLTTSNNLTGCENTQEVFVEIDQTIPTLTFLAPLLTCVVPEREIQLFPDGDYEYNWILPNLETQEGMLLIAQDTGIYQLFLTAENGCVNQYEILVQGNGEKPEFEVIQPAPITCANDRTIIEISSDELLAGFTATLNEAAEFSFGNGMLVTDQPGQWIVQATASNGCTNTVAFEIEIDTIPPTPEILTQDINCQNTQGLMSIVDQNPNSFFQWVESPGDTLAVNEFIPMNQENIIVIETASNGCIGMDTAMINIDTLSPTLSAQASIISCNDLFSLAEVIDPIDSLEYTWLFESELISDESELETNITGEYTVMVTNPINFCSSEQIVSIEADPNILIDFSFLVEPPPCGFDEFSLSNIEILGGEGPYQYATQENDPVWISDQESSSLSEGVNFIQIQDANGCMLDTIISLSLPEPVEASIPSELTVSWARDTTLQLILNKPLEEIESILWTPENGLSCNDCLMPTLNILEGQTYQISVIDINGCEDLVEIRIDVDREISVYIPNVFTPDEQDNNLFFPFTTEQHISKIDNFYIFDRWGNRVYSNFDFSPNDPSAGWDGTILNDPASPGVYAYYLEIFYNDGSIELKLGDVTLVR